MPRSATVDVQCVDMMEAGYHGDGTSARPMCGTLHPNVKYLFSDWPALLMRPQCRCCHRLESQLSTFYSKKKKESWFLWIKRWRYADEFCFFLPKLNESIFNFLCWRDITRRALSLEGDFFFGCDSGFIRREYIFEHLMSSCVRQCQ